MFIQVQTTGTGVLKKGVIMIGYKQVVMGVAVVTAMAGQAKSDQLDPIFCEGASRVTNYVADLTPNSAAVTIGTVMSLQNKGNVEAGRIAPLTVDHVDRISGAGNGVVFISGRFNDLRRVNVQCGTFEIQIGPQRANLLMKNMDGTIHDFFGLDCRR